MTQLPTTSSRRKFLKYSTLAVTGTAALSTQSRSARAEPELAWTFDNDSGYGADLLAYDQTFYYADSQGSVFAFEPTSGENKWSAQTGAEHVLNGMAATDEYLATLGDESTLTVLNRETGERQWRRSVGRTGRAITWSADGQTLYALSYAGNSSDMLVESYQSDGTPNWSSEVTVDDRVIHTTPGELVVRGERIICAGTDAIGILDEATGEVETIADVAGYARSDDKSLAVADGTIYTTTEDGTVAVDMNTGNTIWTSEFNSSDEGTVAGVTDEAVICGNYDTVYALGRGSGQVQWQSGIGVIYRALGLSNDGIYGVGAVDDKATIYKLNPSNGLEEWRQQLDTDFSDDLIGPPQVSQGHVIAGVTPEFGSTNTLYTVMGPDWSPQQTESDTPMQPDTASKTESAMPTQTQAATQAQPDTQASQTEQPPQTSEAAPSRSSGKRGLFTNGQGENPLGIEARSLSMGAISAVMGGIGALAALAQMRGDN